MTTENFRFESYPVDKEDQYDEFDCQQHLLSAAAYMNYVSVAEDLITKGYSPYLKSPIFEQPLYLAARPGSNEIVSLFLSSKPGTSLLPKPRRGLPNFDLHCDPQTYAIRGAIDGGHLETLKLALDPRWGPISHAQVPFRGFVFNALKTGQRRKSLAVFRYVEALLRPQLEAHTEEYLARLLAVAAENGNLRSRGIG